MAHQNEVGVIAQSDVVKQKIADQLQDEDIRIVMAEPSRHRHGIVQLMQTAFLPREPVQCAMGIQWSEAETSITYEVDEALNQPYSFVAVSPLDGVVGCRLSMFERIENPSSDMDMGADMDTETDADAVMGINDFVAVVGNAPKLRKFQALANEFMRGWKREMYERGCRNVFHFTNMCVDEKYAGRGLAKRMVEESVRVAKRLQSDCICAVATNHVSQRVLAKSGFQEWRSRDYEDLLDQETGQPFAVPQDGSRCIKWMVKPLARQPSSG